MTFSLIPLPGTERQGDILSPPSAAYPHCRDATWGHVGRLRIGEPVQGWQEIPAAGYAPLNDLSASEIAQAYPGRSERENISA